MAFAIFWTVVTLVPVLNFRLLPEGEIAHDRYLYLPSVGFAILVGIALQQVARVRAVATRGREGVLVGLVFICALGLATARQSIFWSDDLSLNYRAHQIAPHNVSATTSLAAAVEQRGMNSAAITLYRQALAVRPKLWQANVNLGYLYYARGDFSNAARFFSRSCAADPADGDQFLFLGMSLLRMGRLAEAEIAVRTALLARPWGKHYHLGLGMVLKEEGRFADARQEVIAELAQDPQNSQAKSLLNRIAEQAITNAGGRSQNLDSEGQSLPDKR